MNTVKCSSLAVLSFMVAGLLAFLVYSGTAYAQTKAVLSGKDCGKCHAGQVYDITAAGGRHGGVPCSGCHAGHPPEVKKPIAPCSKCHLQSRNAHFEAEGCPSCHTNPHRPLSMSFKGANNDTCIICHGVEGWQLRKQESKHSAINCSKCHDVHRKIPQCIQCHKPHKGMISGGCKLCHAAHMPKVSALPEAYPSKDCGSCHRIVADLLGATATKHKTLACVGCHQLKHGFKPACQDCHGTPHPEGILAKFPECVMCHYSPHDLNNWPETATEEAPGEARKNQ